MTLESQLAQLQAGNRQNYWAERITSQLEYAYRLSKVDNRAYDDLLSSVLDYLLAQQEQTGVITREAAEEAEKRLSELSQRAKSYRLLCAAHAHIDMNWMWRWDETVAITLDTFRTMLDLMEEYPYFKFSQSQASVYKIVEDYAPHMLDEIRRRVKEGRWEVTASTWVETDKNMPSGESLARHILYTKRYLSELLDIDPESLDLDFEPDTFGHSLNVPEILAAGGIKYYYHCRGDEGYYLQRWEAPSGRSVIVYREPFWYLGYVGPYLAIPVPEFCHQHGINTAMRVYGVGDHGGGPTRRDLERIIDMNTWPVFPRLEFGTFREFFRVVEEIKDTLPIVRHERNFVFTGCYTSQARIKAANRTAEAALNEAEAFSSLAAINADWPYRHRTFTDAWRRVLFSHFHDIITGSCVPETRDHALGLFQETMAAAGSSKKLALQALAANIDTSALTSSEDIAATTAEGAGVGFGVNRFKVSQASRGAGKTRIFHIFNPSIRRRQEIAELVVWDWDGDLDRLVCKDAQGRVVNHQLLDSGVNQYWGHSYVRLLVEVDVPPYGYSTYVVAETDEFQPQIRYPRDPRLEKPDCFVLENEHIKAVLDSVNCTVVSLLDKETGEELVTAQRPAGIFRLIQEDPRYGMTSWRVGRYMTIEDLTRDVHVLDFQKGCLRQSLTYRTKFKDSQLDVTVSLDKGSRVLSYDVSCDWQERGRPGENIPQLNFYAPVSYQCAGYRYDVPFGTIDRQPMDLDVPGNSFMVGLPEGGSGSQLMLVTDSKYGFRGNNDALAVSLIRGSYDPDRYPDIGFHHFRLGLCAVPAASLKQELIQQAYDYNHPLTVISSRPQTGGSWPLVHGFIQLEAGTVAVSAVKVPEDAEGKEMLIRLYETEGRDTTAALIFCREIEEAVLVDINEKPIAGLPKPEIQGRKVVFPVGAARIASLKLVFA
ncbi:MAG TPA: alpha-mannosidase [Firmicutes bacterium]|nr:alpha-mannosidase [Bacillota bacterium]